MTGVGSGVKVGEGTNKGPIGVGVASWANTSAEPINNKHGQTANMRMYRDIGKPPRMVGEGFMKFNN
jgi:hypothetical protein